jgi:hypothetical protein
MRIRFCLAVTAIVLLMGYPHDRQLRAEPAATPTPGPAPGAVAPDATGAAFPTVACPSADLHLPAPQPGDTAIEPATYTVCDVGDPKDSQTSKGGTLEKHLVRGDRVTICELDEVMRLKFTFTHKGSRETEFDAAAFIVDDKARELKALNSFEHGKGQERHLVKITRNNEGYVPPLNETLGCNKKEHQIIRIQFCYFDAGYSNRWRCPGKGPGKSGAHQGDIHAQN